MAKERDLGNAILVALYLLVVLWLACWARESSGATMPYPGHTPPGMICFSWTGNPTDGKTLWYQLYQDTRSNPVGDRIPFGETAICADLPTDGVAHNFFLAAGNDDAVSGNSDVVAVYPQHPDPGPPPDPPVVVGGFRISIAVEPLSQ